MQLNLIISILHVVSTAVATPFVQKSFFSHNHDIILENPILFQELESIRKSESNTFASVEKAWNQLLKDVPNDYLKELVDDVLKIQKNNKPETPQSFKEPKFKTNIDIDSFEVLEHHDYYNHQLRIKSTDPMALGLDTVEQYVGYFDVRDVDKHFFYWFFESRNDPENDPVVLWLNGGPGCASDGGMLFELGPSWINASVLPDFNPYSWNSNASVIFLDQPVGVGYSYAGKEDVDNTNDSAKDVYIFLELFFKKFPQFMKNKFHVSGESYAGHYVPRIAAEIIRHPERSFELTSILVGNGDVDMLYQKKYDQKMLCGEGGLEGILSQENCTQMEENLDKCLLFQGLCSYIPGIATCVPQSYYCNKTYGPLNDLNLNRYDLRRPCEDNRLCYKAFNTVEQYMNSEFVKEIIGVPDILEFQFCNHEVGLRFGKTHDGTLAFQKYIAEVLDYGVPVLHYAGDQDFVCHWLGYNAVSSTVQYADQDQFSQSKFKPWVTKSGKEAGQVRNYDKFTFLRVYQAGHMVPHDQPEVALEMFNTWLSGDYSLST